jgi:hypothetical protein
LNSLSNSYLSSTRLTLERLNSSFLNSRTFKLSHSLPLELFFLELSNIELSNSVCLSHIFSSSPTLELSLSGTFKLSLSPLSPFSHDDMVYLALTPYTQISDCVGVRDVEVSGEHAFALLVRSGKSEREFRLGAFSKKEKEEWMQLLTDQITNSSTEVRVLSFSSSPTLSNSGSLFLL